MNITFKPAVICLNFFLYFALYCVMFQKRKKIKEFYETDCGQEIKEMSKEMAKEKNYCD